jgi:hypothetical protein
MLSHFNENHCTIGFLVLLLLILLLWLAMRQTRKRLNHLIQQLGIDVSENDVTVLHRPDALQYRPVLEPLHLVLSLEAESLDKRLVDEVVDNGLSLFRELPGVTGHGQWRLQPDADVRKIRHPSVGPIVPENPVVGSISERLWILDFELERAIGLGGWQRVPA